MESISLTSVPVNNEVEFCKVYNLAQKEALEKLLLKNRISFYVKWEEQSFFRRLFASETKEKVVFTMCIHDAMVSRAKELVDGMADIKLLL